MCGPHDKIHDRPHKTGFCSDRTNGLFDHDICGSWARPPGTALSIRRLPTQFAQCCRLRPMLVILKCYAGHPVDAGRRNAGQGPSFPHRVLQNPVFIFYFYRNDHHHLVSLRHPSTYRKLSQTVLVHLTAPKRRPYGEFAEWQAECRAAGSGGQSTATSPRSPRLIPPGLTHPPVEGMVNARQRYEVGSAYSVQPFLHHIWLYQNL